MKLLSMMLLGASLSLAMPTLALAQADLNSSLAITNVAAGKPTSQISTDYGGIPSRAVDGNLDGNMDHGSVTHTNTAVGAWWEVDLQQATTIQRISVYNRTECCGDRLSNFSVQILDADRVVVKEFIISGTASNVMQFAAAGSRGRHVRIQLHGNSVLSLAEVQVWADI